MKRLTAKILALTAVVLVWTLRVSAGNQVTLSNAEGAPGAEVRVTVSLASDVPIAALQVSAALGDAAVAVNGSAQTTGRATSHEASCGTKDGITTLMLYSTTMATIEAGDGTVAEFTLRMGAHPMNFNPDISVKATDVSGNEIACSGNGLAIAVLGATATYPSGPAYDYGRVPIRSTHALSIPVTNTGVSPLVIDNVRFSSTDFSCQTSLPMTIVAGSTETLNIAYTPMERGDISATATIVSNSSMPDNTLRLLAQAFAVNEVHVGNASGVSDTEVTVPITVNNMDAVTGFTLEFELPSHLQYVNGSFTLSQRAVDHSLSASMSNGRLRATAYSLTDTPFDGEDGEIASFKVRLLGRNSISLNASKAVLSAVVNRKVTDVTSATYPGSISILYPQISAANSISLGRTPITEDATATLQIRNYGNAPLTIERIVSDGMEMTLNQETPFEIGAYSSENIIVTYSGKTEGDISGTLQIYSNDPEQRLFNVAVSGERYAPNSICFTAGPVETSTQKCALDLVLENYDAISGIQFDITMPTGFEPDQVLTIDRARNFTVTYNKINATTVRYFAYSLNGSNIEPGHGEIMQLPFNYPANTSDGYYTFTISEVKLSSPQMTDRSSIVGNIVCTVELTTTIQAQSVTINGVPDYLEYPGDGVTLAAIVSPDNTTDKTVEWSTSNPNVATVDASGKVTPTGIGTVEITAKAVGGDNVSTTRSIEVKGKAYMLTFYIDEKSYQAVSVRFGDSIVAPEVEPREGYTFSGWKDMPTTMPAHDVNVYGTFNVNSYTVTFYLDGEKYQSYVLAYGADIVASEVGPREGYTFSGWKDLPSTMPAHDVDVYGAFNVNSYTVIFYLDGEIYAILSVEYGSIIEIPQPEVPEGRRFDGWQEEDIPERMPARDVEIHGTTSEVSVDVATIIADGNTLVDIYNIYGIRLWHNIRIKDVPTKLNSGYYIMKCGHKKIKIKI